MAVGSAPILDLLNVLDRHLLAEELEDLRLVLAARYPHPAFITPGNLAGSTKRQKLQYAIEVLRTFGSEALACLCEAAVTVRPRDNLLRSELRAISETGAIASPAAKSAPTAEPSAVAPSAADGAKQDAGRTAESFISYADRRRLIEELNRLPAWSVGGVLGERSVLLGAGLPQGWVSGHVLTGSGPIDAELIVTSLESLQHLESRPTHRALGALADYLFLNTPHVEGKQFLAYLIQYYGLITDPNYLRDLQAKYPLPVWPAPGQVLGRSAEQPPFTWQGPKDPAKMQRITSTDTPFVDAVFLEKGAQLARSVCRIEDQYGAAAGTGFLIAPDRVMTNDHVLPAAGHAPRMRARFGYRVDQSGQLQAGETYPIAEAICRSPGLELDYVILLVEGAPGSKPEIGYVVPAAGEVKVGERVYIIQHCAGEPQKVVLQDNKVTYVAPDGRRLQYLANTEDGSSGSPVCNEHWEVVALHHSGGPLPGVAWRVRCRWQRRHPYVGDLAGHGRAVWQQVNPLNSTLLEDQIAPS